LAGIGFPARPDAFGRIVHRRIDKRTRCLRLREVGIEGLFENRLEIFARFAQVGFLDESSAQRLFRSAEEFPRDSPRKPTSINSSARHPENCQTIEAKL
jgi:hypothetical protein